jgi:hypothetical protein
MRDIRQRRDCEIFPEVSLGRCEGCSLELQRRYIQIDQIKYIGKEASSLENVESGSIYSAQNVDTEYPDPRRGEWQAKIRPALKKVPLSRLVELSSLSRRALQKARADRTRPHRRNQELLASVVRKLDAL